MTVVFFGIGSPLVADYEETCARLGFRVAAGVQNRPGPVWIADRAAIVDAGAVAPDLLAHACFCPLFTPANRAVASAEAAALGFRFPHALIDPTAIVASTAAFGAGTYVNAGCIVGAGAKIGDQVVLNRGASIGHHAVLERFASIGPGAVLAGGVTVGPLAVVGAGAVVLPQIAIGERATVGAGAVVVRPVPPGATVTGNPARIIRGG